MTSLRLVAADDLPPPPPIVDPIETKNYRWYLTELGMSSRTTTQYARFVERADAWCEERGYPLSTVPGPVIAEFAKTLPKSHASRRLFRSAIVHYWRMYDRSSAPVWAIRVPKRPRMVCRALEPEEAARLARAATARGDRAGLAVLIGLYQALRAAEIAAVRWEDFTADGWLKVIGKGDLPAQLPLNPVVRQAVDRFRTDLEGKGPLSPWVFPGRDGESHVHPTTVWVWVKRVAAEVGIANMATHRLRHTALATALDETTDLRAVRDFARHADVSTTQGYTRTTERRLRAVMNAINYSEEPEGN